MVFAVPWCLGFHWVPGVPRFPWFHWVQQCLATTSTNGYHNHSVWVQWYVGTIAEASVLEGKGGKCPPPYTFLPRGDISHQDSWKGNIWVLFLKNFPTGACPQTPQNDFDPQFETKLTPLHAGAYLGGGHWAMPPLAQFLNTPLTAQHLGTTVPGFHSTWVPQYLGTMVL